MAHPEYSRRPDTRISAEARIRGNLVVKEKYRLRREDAYRAGVEEFDFLCTDPTFRDFVCIYIGQGQKRDRNKVSIRDSDPKVVRLGNAWICRLTRNPVSHDVEIHADQSLDELRAFWAEVLDVDGSVIKFRRKPEGGRTRGGNRHSRNGVLTVRCFDTYLRARLQAWMELVKANWG